MTRLFLSLYIFVAISIVIVGIGLEKVLFDEQSSQTPAQRALLSLVASQQNQPNELVSLLTDAGADVTIMPAAQFASSSSIGTALQARQIVEGMQEDQWVVMIPTSDGQVIHALFPMTTKSPAPWLLYSTLFFALLGVAIAFWVAPIWRDLKKLSLASETLRPNGTLDIPKLAKQSPLTPLVEGYATLNSSIRHLIKQHKALAGAITHEFKTPLARLRFAINAPGQYTQAQIDAIKTDIVELENLVQEMLDFTRLDVHEPDLHIEDIPLQALCNQRKDKFAATTDIAIECIGDTVVLLADANLLTRALDNLLSNAIRHASNRVRIAITCVEQVVISVEDDGAGVSAKDKTKLFEPFYRADSHRSRQHGGTGLGLAIVQRIMQWHKGSCDVTQSSLGGAAFVLRFPPQSHRV